MIKDNSERLEVEKVIHDSIGWALTKDIDRLFSIMAQDDDFFIFLSGRQRGHAYQSIERRENCGR